MNGVSAIILLSVGEAVLAALTTSKIDLVKVLKSNLRANNDDYVEMDKNSTDKNLTNAATKSQIPDSPIDQPVNELNGEMLYRNDALPFGINNRRKEPNLVSGERYDYDSRQNGFEVVDPATAKDVGNVFNATTHKEVNTNPTTVISAMKPIADKEEIVLRSQQNPQAVKMKNFKKFIKKNIGFISQFLKKKRLGEISKATTIATTATTAQKNYQYKHDLRFKADEVRPRAATPREPPAPALLDMAPAKGALVHKMRVRGRLCQRNVLLPEGPKYDSGGRAYLGAWQHARGRDYAATRAHKLLLPRCCNCCKKSVLGCQ